MAQNQKTRFVNGWRLSIKPRQLAGRRTWYVIFDQMEGQTYMFSRHMNYDWALLRMQSMDPDECQHTPYRE